MTKYKYVRSLTLLLIALLLNACSNTSEPVELTDADRGKIIESEQTAEYNLAYIAALLSFAGENINIQPVYAVTAYRITYYTIDTDNNVVEASGALYAPVKSDSSPLLGLQHGTQSDRDLVASVDPNIGLEGMIGTSLGYYSAEADYLGLGVSTLMHPYHHAKSSATCIIDFLRAVRSFAATHNISLNDQIFLAGYSEGGFVTLAAHKEIEQNYSNEFQLTAVSAMAGAFNLEQTAIEIIQSGTYTMPGFITFMITAYNHVYCWNRLNDFFNEPYASQMNTLFNGTKSISQINLQLTSDLSQLFKASFIQGISNGTETTVLNAFRDNSLLNWTPVTPLLLVHGDADEYVPYSNSVTAFNTFTANGASVELITIPGGTHSSSVIPAIISTMQWFSAFSNQDIILAKRDQNR